MKKVFLQHEFVKLKHLLGKSLKRIHIGEKSFSCEIYDKTDRSSLIQPKQTHEWRKKTFSM